MNNLIALGLCRSPLKILLIHFSAIITCGCPICPVISLIEVWWLFRWDNNIIIMIEGMHAGIRFDGLFRLIHWYLNLLLLNWGCLFWAINLWRYVIDLRQIQRCSLTKGVLIVRESSTSTPRTSCSCIKRRLWSWIHRILRLNLICTYSETLTHTLRFHKSLNWYHKVLVRGRRSQRFFLSLCICFWIFWTSAVWFGSSKSNWNLWRIFHKILRNWSRHSYRFLRASMVIAIRMTGLILA